MNERIKELVEQADNIEILPDEEFCDTDFLADIDPRRVKKFAELIVRECCNKIERKYKYALGEKTQWAMSQDVQDLLKEHFGVEQ